MPTYEYACRECGQHLEVVQSFKDATLTTCGSCGGALRKVFSAAGIIFKGSGYYVNDTRKKDEESTSATSGKDGGGKDSGDKDSKPGGDSAPKSPESGKTSQDSGKSSSDSSTKGGAAESA
ncbi:MAG TPA: FmdB family zinc ribbon protein [Egibacteraceae bacterium]|nr:FmdB family zinc ribbon protein [Egibacteraceae bacterium]